MGRYINQYRSPGDHRWQDVKPGAGHNYDGDDPVEAERRLLPLSESHSQTEYRVYDTERYTIVFRHVGSESWQPFSMHASDPVPTGDLDIAREFVEDWHKRHDGLEYGVHDSSAGRVVYVASSAGRVVYFAGQATSDLPPPPKPTPGVTPTINSRTHEESEAFIAAMASEFLEFTSTLNDAATDQNLCSEYDKFLAGFHFSKLPKPVGRPKTVVVELTVEAPAVTDWGFLVTTKADRMLEDLLGLEMHSVNTKDWDVRDA